MHHEQEVYTIDYQSTAVMLLLLMSCLLSSCRGFGVSTGASSAVPAPAAGSWLALCGVTGAYTQTSTNFQPMQKVKMYWSRVMHLPCCFQLHILG